MKPFPTIAALLVGLTLMSTTVPARAADEAPAPAASPADAKTLGSDTIVVIVSDTPFGPDMTDAEAAARYYCSNRGKLSAFVGKDRPMEFRSQVLQQWSLMTYHCYSANGG